MSEESRIQPFAENRFYWQYKGKPALLLGGSVEDNLYQIPDLEAHLDLLASCGGNYVRCTMSCRDPGDVWWFEKDGTGLYDLNKLGEEHWTRFERFMELTAEREIFAQFEIWDRFDFARENWVNNPASSVHLTDLQWTRKTTFTSWIPGTSGSRYSTPKDVSGYSGAQLTKKVTNWRE